MRSIIAGSFRVRAVLAATLVLMGCGGADAPQADNEEDRRQARLAAGQPNAGGDGYTGETLWSEAGKLIRGDESLVALGNEMFGDRVSMYNGALEFVQTDVSVPGNSALPVAVGRRHTAPVNVGEAPRQVLNGIFGDWDLEIPRMHGVFGNGGWTVDWPGQAQQRCSRYGAPPAVAVGQGTVGAFSAQEYWQGNSIYVPGAGSQEVLKRVAGQAPTDGASYPLTTKDRWMIKCLPSMARGSGEGFLAIAPDGTQYRFDWMVSRTYGTLVKGTAAPGSRQQLGNASERGSKGGVIAPEPNLMGGYPMQRTEVWIMPTEVKDRHGNTVTYQYDSANPWRLRFITGTDAAGSPRSIELTYNASGLVDKVKTVVAGALREWTYGYRASTVGVGYVLSSLTLPDGSAWSFNLDAITYGGKLLWAGGGCYGENLLDEAPHTGTMTHPSGATGSFTVVATHHGRSHVDEYCANMTDGDAATGNQHFPKFVDRFSITSKTISGAGLASKTWTYQYGPHNASFAPCAGCATTKTVEMTDPEGARTRYTFGIQFRVNEGQLLRTDEGWDGSTALKTTVRTYASPTNGPWPDPIGSSIQIRGNGELASRYAPERLKEITQQGAVFTWQVNLDASGKYAFDQFAKPLDVTKKSTLDAAYERREVTTYNHHFAKWVLSQPESVTELGTGLVIEQNTYDPATANRTEKRAFGRLLERYTYYAAGEASPGTVKTKTDARNNVTTLSNYKRGLAQTAGYADGTSESAVIHDNGSVASITNAAGKTTSYGYDAVGRLSSITYPGGDAVAYNTTFLDYERVPTLEYGVSGTHWRLTRRTGDARTQTIFDAQWRPVMTRTWDNGAGKEASTRRVKVMRYDSAGRKTFESYPQRDIASVSTPVDGTTTTYDALGRVTRQLANSEIGDLITSTTYPLGSFQRVVSNPRQKVTTHTFQAFDEPSEDRIAGIWAPEGVQVTIARDRFGKATSIKRAGNGKSATRSYVYDAYQRLCKTLEPETGATVVAYDGQSELKSWSASGYVLPSGNCDQGQVAEAHKIGYGYDLRNRLTSTTYGDGSPGITRGYTLDGLLQSVTTNAPGNAVSWTYHYNNRRAMDWEELSTNAGTWRFSYTIDANGHTAALQDPLGTQNYAPNALGEATQVGSYASGAAYHPSGALTDYTYGNGVVHSTTLYTRGLPQRIQNGSVTKDAYTYDENGNVMSITDEVGPNTRTMTPYDGLDRLMQVSGSQVSASYTYDALDNMTTSTVTTPSGGTRSLTHGYDGNNRLTSVTGSQNITFGYNDSAGMIGSNIASRGSQGFVFDIGNRMTSATGKASYVYDGHGRRSVASFAAGGVQYSAYTHDGKLRLSYRTGVGYTRYAYLGNKLVAEDDGTAKYTYNDALGSPIAKQTGSGTVERTYYEPYGATAVGTNPSKIGFTGHFNDVDTGLVYMQQRYYEPQAGRFLSVDPVVTDLNTGNAFGRYHYAENNPFRYTDPTGMESEERTEDGYLKGSAIAKTVERERSFATPGFWLAGGDGPLPRGITPGIFTAANLYAADNAPAAMLAVAGGAVAAWGATNVLGALTVRQSVVTLANSIRAGRVNPDGRLAQVLGAIEQGAAANAPKSALEALGVVNRAAEGVGLELGVARMHGGSILIQHAGGVMTTLAANGTIAVSRGASVLLRTGR